MSEAYAEKQVVIVGAGSTGRALCDFFLAQGARVVLSDRSDPERIPGKEELRARGVALDLGGHTPERFAAADLVVVSPGVPLTLPAIVAARQAEVPVLGEIEVAARELSAPLVAVTGTNGKSTTTCVAGEIFRAWGRRTFVGGNLGPPLITAAARRDWDYVVAEISSFQLEAVAAFRPRYGLLLNISPDHLDRYPGIAEYVAAKRRLFANMGPQDVAVVNAEDSEVMAATAGLNLRRVAFSSRRLLDQGMGFAGGQLVWRDGEREERFPAGELRLRGMHNLENVMAALIPPLLEGCPPPLAWRAASGFAGLPHRMVAVRVLDGVTWYNDSKGTNVGSVVKGLAGLPAPVTLIAGGRDKGGEYAPLREAAAGKVACLILIGEAADRIAAELGETARTLRAGSLAEAVHLARQVTPPGGTVLFSPACSSFDMFRNYQERGEVFTRAVQALASRGGN